MDEDRTQPENEAPIEERFATPLDTTLFQLDDEVYAEFKALLAAPPEPSDALRELLRAKAPWDRSGRQVEQWSVEA